MQPYDYTEEFERDVKPLMDEVIERCKAIGIPIVASFAPGYDGENAKLCTCILPVKGRSPDVYLTAHKLLRDEIPSEITTVLHAITHGADVRIDDIRVIGPDGQQLGASSDQEPPKPNRFI